MPEPKPVVRGVFSWLSSGRQSVARPELGRAGCQRETQVTASLPLSVWKWAEYEDGLIWSGKGAWSCSSLFHRKCRRFLVHSKLPRLCGFGDFPNLLEFTIFGVFPGPGNDSEMKVGLSSREPIWLWLLGPTKSRENGEIVQIWLVINGSL